MSVLSAVLLFASTLAGLASETAQPLVPVPSGAEVWLQDENLERPTDITFGVNGITLLGGRLYTVVTDRAALFSIDPTLESPTGDDLRLVRLTSLDGGAFDLVRPDGITAVPDSNTDILVVENGLGVEGGGKKLLRVRLDRQ